MTRPEAAAAALPVDLADQLALAFERIAGLSRQIERLREEAADRDAAMQSLRDAWRTVDGRTQRHEAGQDAIRDLRALVEGLSERLEQESALRREADTAAQQGIERERDAFREVARAVDELRERLNVAEQAARAEAAERFSLVAALGEADDRAGRLAARLDDIEQRAAADREAALAAGAGVSALEARLPSLVSAIDALDVQLREGAVERRALAEAVASLRSTRDREAELLELLAQQRATRERLEERLVAVEEGLSEVGRALVEAAEQRAQLRLQLGAVSRGVEALAERLEAQRGTVLDHFRALVDAEEEAGRRVREETERRVRRLRDLLVRLSEQSEAEAREQPL